MADNNTFTQSLSYPYLDRIASEEGFRSKPYKDPGGTKNAIGFGFYLDNPKQYEQLAKNLGIKDPYNLTLEDGKKILAVEVNKRKVHMDNAYKVSDPNIRDIMLSVLYQHSPKGFEKRFGESLRKNDINGLVNQLTIIGQQFEDKGLKGVNNRWKRVSRDLLKYQEMLNGINKTTNRN